MPSTKTDPISHRYLYGAADAFELSLSSSASMLPHSLINLSPPASRTLAFQAKNLVQPFSPTACVLHSLLQNNLQPPLSAPFQDCLSLPFFRSHHMVPVFALFLREDSVLEISTLSSGELQIMLSDAGHHYHRYRYQSQILILQHIHPRTFLAPPFPSQAFSQLKRQSPDNLQVPNPFPVAKRSSPGQCVQAPVPYLLDLQTLLTSSVLKQYNSVRLQACIEADCSHSPAAQGPTQSP